VHYWLPGNTRAHDVSPLKAAGNRNSWKLAGGSPRRRLGSGLSFSATQAWRSSGGEVSRDPHSPMGITDNGGDVGSLCGAACCLVCLFSGSRVLLLELAAVDAEVDEKKY